MAASAAPMQGSGSADDSLFADAGRRLLEAVNLPDRGGDGIDAPRYAPHNALWAHPETGAVVYVGNAETARSKPELARLAVTRIVNCQTSDGACWHEADPAFRYLRFPIGTWRGTLAANADDAAVLAYFAQLFDFVDAETAAGNNVLIHCLAGAHRAGTCGVACLMHCVGFDARTAVRAAKRLRPAIDPIGSFPMLLGMLDRALAASGRGAAFPTGDRPAAGADADAGADAGGGGAGRGAGRPLPEAP